MKIESSTMISHPIEAVFEVYRNRLPELARYLPDIREIVVESREELDDGIKLHNIWIASADIPSFAKAFIKPELLRWNDYATWHDADYVCHWKIVTGFASEAVRCSGITGFEAKGDSTRVYIDGDLSLDLKKVPGVPKLLAGSIGPKVEAFVVKLITPNLQKTNQAIQDYLDAQ